MWTWFKIMGLGLVFAAIPFVVEAFRAPVVLIYPKQLDACQNFCAGARNIGYLQVRSEKAMCFCRTLQGLELTAEK